MKVEELFEAIGGIDDELVLCDTSKKKNKLKSFIIPVMASAACLALVIGVAGLLNKNEGAVKVPTTSESESQMFVINEEGEYMVPSLDGGFGCDESADIESAEYTDLNQAGIAPLSDSNSDDGINFGPLMPMTFTEANGSITADRDITYDFTDSPANGIVSISDEYVITNTSGEAQTLTYMYPYIGYRYEILENKPVVTVDGVEKMPAIHNGIYKDYTSYGEATSYLQLSSTDDYGTMLKDGVAGTAPKIDENIINDVVTVYEFGYPFEVEAEYPSKMCAMFRVEKEYMSSVYCVNMSLLYEDETYVYYGYLYEEEANFKETSMLYHNPMLIFVDEAPENITAFNGYLNEDNWEYVPNDEISVESNVYECSYKELATELANTKLEGTQYASDEEYKELFLDKLLIMLSDSVTYRKNSDDLDTEYYMIGPNNDLAWFVYEAWRPYGFYLLQDTITVGAGESITIGFNYDRIGKYWEEPEEKYKGIFGYDNIPNLGTNITFTGQSAAIADNGNIEIVEQNYGFDLANNIRQVELKLDAESYYMYIRFIE
ncbi:MAG: hypothetical protein IJX85_12135 [Lachnospiraceae bacterium]|nr:hypothetical protein [Lachnospiraceae bacterium]